MVKRNKIPNWGWVVIAILCLIVFLLLFVMNDSVKQNKDNPTERLCIDMCGGQLTLCNAQVLSLGLEIDCNAKWDICIDSCNL